MKLWVLLIITAMLSSCSPDPEEHVFSVAAYNAYCLFDGIRDGDEFEGWRKSDGYTEAVYDKRVDDLAVLLGKYVSADVIILEEVESEIVLRDLIDSGLRKKGYFHYGLATTGNEAISVGFLSRIRPDAVRIHSFEGHCLLFARSKGRQDNQSYDISKCFHNSSGFIDGYRFLL